MSKKCGSVFTCKEVAVITATFGLILVGMGTCAKAETVRVQVVPPTVAGIEDHGPRYSPYPGPRRQYAPSAGVVRLWEPVGATPCGEAFEVISGPRAARGCLR